MKTNVKKISLLAVSVCAATACAATMAACGANYSNYTYSDYSKIAESEWDAKTISYQLYTTETVAGPMGNNAEYLLNLYSDGSALLYQAGLWTYTADDANWVDQDNHVAYGYYGLWQEDDSNITVRLLGKEADKDETVKFDDSWVPVDRNAEPPADFEGDHYDAPINRLQYIFAKSGDNAYKLVTTSTNFFPMGVTNKYMGAALESKEDNGQDNAGAVSKLTTEVKYSKIGDWMNSYLKDSDGNDVTFPAKDAGM